jgi:hypothetical protein
MANSPFIFGANGSTSLVPGGVTLPGSTSGTLQIQPAAATTSYTLTMPAAQGGSTNTLSNDGSGNLSWVTGLPAVGTDGQLIKSMNSTYIQSSYYTPYKNYIGNSFAEINTNGWGTRNFQQTVTITIASPAVFTVTSTTGFYVGMPISFTTTGALPTGLTASTIYYIFSVNSSTTFEVTATLGGSVINASGSQSGTHTSYPLVPINNTSVALSGLTFSRSTSSPIHDSGDFSLVQTNSTVVAGQALAYPITLDSADQGQVISISFDYNASSTFVASSGQTGSDSDLEVCLWDATNSVLIPISPKVLTANGTNNWTFKGVCQTNSNSTSYVLIIYTPTMNANSTGWNFIFSNVYCGRQPILYGPPIQNWGSYSLTIGAVTTPPTPGSGATKTAVSRRIGDSIEIHFEYSQSNAGNGGSGIYLFPIPSGLSIDTTKIPVNTNGVSSTVGVSSGNYGGGSPRSGVVVAYNSTNLAMALVGSSGNTFLVSSSAYDLGSNSNVQYSFTAIVPIVGWSSSTLMSNDANTNVIAARMTGATATVTSSYSDVTWTTIVNDTSGAMGSTTYTIPVSGYYNICGSLYISAASITAGQIFSVSLFNISTSTTLLESTYVYQGTNTTSNSLPFNFKDVLFSSGNTFKIQIKATTTTPAITSSATENYLSIEKVTGPSAISATESVNGRYFSSTTTISSSLATVVYATKGWDTHGAYNNSTGIWTCPVSGKYEFNAAIDTAGTYVLNNILDLQVQQSGSSSQISESKIFAPGAATNLTASVPDLFYCQSGDTIKVQVSSQATGPTIVSNNNTNYISWTRVGN